MQASSEYEPSRVLMLLDALLTPVPRNLDSVEHKHEGGEGWRMLPVTSGPVSLMRLTRAYGGGNVRALNDSYLFLSQGLLVMRSERDIVTQWSDDFIFDGKAVPRHIAVMAVDRQLVTADVTIEPAGKVDAGTLDLPGDAADPGMTLRPLREFEVNMPELMFERSFVVSGGAPSPMTGYTISVIFDKHGRYRDVELILAQNQSDAKVSMDMMRKEQHHNTATIDGKPCEVRVNW